MEQILTLLSWWLRPENGLVVLAVTELDTLVKWEWIEKWHNRLYKGGEIFAFLCWVPGVGDLFAVGLGLLRSNIWITASAMLAGKFLGYVVWGWLTGLVF